MSGKNPYKILGITREASADEIKKTYRRLVREYHPDANPAAPQAEERFKEIQQAYETVSNPERRDEYDRSAHARPETSRRETGSAAGEEDYTGSLQEILKKFGAARVEQGRDRGFKEEDLAQVLKLLGAGLSRNVSFKGKDASVEVNVDFGKPRPRRAGDSFKKPPEPPKP